MKQQMPTRSSELLHDFLSDLIRVITENRLSATEVLLSHTEMYRIQVVSLTSSPDELRLQAQSQPLKEKAATPHAPCFLYTHIGTEQAE